MKVILNEKDNKILKHVEEYNFITINQAKLLFFNTATGYEMARRHLKKLVKYNFLYEKTIEKLRINHNFLNANEKIFFIDEKKVKNIIYHSIIIMNYYANIVSLGGNISFFKKEFEWLNGKYKSDCTTIFTLGNYKFFHIVEVVRNNTAQNIVEKYNEIIESGEIENKFQSLPMLIIIDDNQYRKYEIGKINVYKIPSDLNGLYKCLL